MSSAVEDAVRRLIEIAAGREARLSESEADELLASMGGAESDPEPPADAKPAGKVK